jgi:DNA-binding SARP family transcriptional activator
VEFRILGPLEVRAGGSPVTIPGAKPRAVLAVLLLHANRSVTPDQLARALWGEEAPSGATKTVQVHVSRLRKALGEEEVVLTTPAGYELRVDVEQVDAHRFERLLSSGRAELAAGRPSEAADLLEQALGEWRGRPLDDLAFEPFAEREIPRLEDLRVAALEQLAEAKLALGAHAEVLARLETLVVEYPYREGLWAQLMLALYRCDRQADALQAYQDARARLVDELGIEPGDRLRELEQAILAQDPALAAPEVAAPPVIVPAIAAPERPPLAAPTAARRLVSIVFVDICGSTAMAERLDPESMHGLLDRFMAACSAVIEEHGGAVEGFAGDSVVGVFGQTVAHEDHALRAVRAAVGLREASAGLDLGVKIGVDTGEVFVGAGARRPRFAAGDAFNVAARLEQAAGEGEILLGDPVRELVRGAVRAERLEPLVLKGKGEAVRAWRLQEIDADGDAIVRSTGTAFVGRERELGLLLDAFARTRDEAACHAVTVLGPAGMGKSRLARELAARLADEATVAVGRCPAYGDEVTYRPLAEIVGALSDGDPRAWLEQVLAGDEASARMVLAAIGLSGEPAQAEEIFWAVRRTFERAAEARPLVVVLDDLQSAQSGLLDLVEHLLTFVRGRPVLLVCLAREELLEARPAWAAPQPQRELLVLDALPEAQAREVVAGAGDIDPATAARIVATAEGNPLFLEHLAAVGAEGAVELPSSIQGVLAARIDRLDPAERALLEDASVEGRTFHVGPLGVPGAPAALVALVRKQLIRPERSDLVKEDAFRFAHALIREAAYRGIAKSRRADAHEHVARWLEERGAPDETVGHHLAEAHRNRTELAPAGAREHALAAAAGQRLTAAADAALLRGDAGAGARLLERAHGLLAGTPADEDLLPALGAALLAAGRGTEAERVLDEAIATVSDARLRARAEVERELVRLETDAAGGRAREVADAALEVLEAAGDDYGQCRAWLLRGQPDWNAGQVSAADAAWERAAACAQRAGSRRELFEVIGWRALAAVLGPTPVDEAIARCEAFRELVAESPVGTASTLNPMALLHAMRGEFEIADALLEQAGEILRELGGLGASVSHLAASVHLLAGRPELAEAPLRADAEALTAMGAQSARATTAALLAQAMLAQGRIAEAGELCGDETGVDIVTEAITRGVRARVLASERRCEDAEALAREAVALVGSTDLLSHHADAMLDLAHVLRTCGNAGADEATQTALALYARKGNTAAARRAEPRTDQGET